MEWHCKQSDIDGELEPGRCSCGTLVKYRSFVIDIRLKNSGSSGIAFRDWIELLIKVNWISISTRLANHWGIELWRALLATINWCAYQHFSFLTMIVSDACGKQFLVELKTKAKPFVLWKLRRIYANVALMLYIFSALRKTYFSCCCCATQKYIWFLSLMIFTQQKDSRDLKRICHAYSAPDLNCFSFFFA